MSTGFGVDRDFTLTAAVGTTPAIPVAGFTVGSVQPPTGSTITSLTIYGSNDETTYGRLHEGGVDLPAITVAAEKPTALPDVCFRHRFIKLVADPAPGGAVRVNLRY